MLKLSGEAFAGQDGDPIDGKVAEFVAQEIVDARELGVDIAVVVGGGNIWRGLTGAGAGHGPRPGRLHGHARHGHQRAGPAGHPRAARASPPACRRAIHMSQVAEPYIRRRAIRHLEKGRVVIFGGGTGNPFFTTDTAAALRAVEIEAGGHAPRHPLRRGGPLHRRSAHQPGRGADPRGHATSTSSTAGLKAMDSTAITLCMDNALPIVMFDLLGKGNVRSILEGNPIGTVVR